MTTVVTVGCKLPAGLILESGTPGTDDYRRIYIAGTNSLHGDSPFRKMSKVPITVQHGCAYTPGIPKDFMDAWLEKHKRLDIVRNSLVFADVNKNAMETGELLEGTKSGLEQMVPKSSTDKPGVISTRAED